MQSTIEAGTTLNYEAAVANYPADEGWVLHFRLVPQDGSLTPITIDSVGPGQVDGRAHLVQVSAPVTAGWAPGAYGYSSWVSNLAGEIYPAQNGPVQILPDSRQVPAGTDMRSQARKALEDARAAFAAWTPTTRRYKIADREREFNTPADILVVIRFWEQQVAVEDRLAGRAEPISRRIYTRI